MVQNAAKLSILAMSPHSPDATEKLRNFASFIASEEVLPAPCRMMVSSRLPRLPFLLHLGSWKIVNADTFQTGSQAGEILEQKLLCVSKVGHEMRVQENGPWAIFLSNLTA